MDNKVCNTCGLNKPLISFEKYQTKTGVKHLNKCSNCKRGTIPKNKPFLQNDVLVKLCKHCQQIKPVSEFRIKSGKVRSCKECENEYNIKKYHSLSIEEKKALNKKRAAKQTREYKRKSQQKRYANPQIRKKILEGQRRRYKPLTKNQKEKYKENMKALVRVYQAKKRNSPIVVKFKKSEIIKRDGLNCYLCEKLLTEQTVVIEHLIPISRGGNHKPENVKIACAHCNHQKYNKTVTEFKKWRGDYSRFSLFPK